MTNATGRHTAPRNDASTHASAFRAKSTRQGYAPHLSPPLSTCPPAFALFPSLRLPVAAHCVTDPPLSKPCRLPCPRLPRAAQLYRLFSAAPRSPSLRPPAPADMPARPHRTPRHPRSTALCIPIRRSPDRHPSSGLARSSPTTPHDPPAQACPSQLTPHDHPG